MHIGSIHREKSNNVNVSSVTLNSQGNIDKLVRKESGRGLRKNKFALWGVNLPLDQPICLQSTSLNIDAKQHITRLQEQG